MDTLSMEIYQGWRVNRYFYHGVPVPHIELISSEAEALDFIGLNLNNNDNDDEGEDYSSVLDAPVEEVVVVVEDKVPAFKPKGVSGQTTLL